MSRRFAQNISIAIMCLLLAGGWYLRPPARANFDDGPPAAPTEETHLASPQGRVLYVVVDHDGAYLDTQRVEFVHARHVVSTLLRQQKIKNLVIYSTHRARYGDAIELHAGIDRGLLEYSAIATKALLSGARKPMTGFYEAHCCSPIDVENNPRAEP